MERKREYQKKYAQKPEEFKKRQTRRRTRTLVASGEIVRGVCEVCGDEKVDVHHHDYDDPFNVSWLCRKHHSDLHKKLRS